MSTKKLNKIILPVFITLFCLITVFCCIFTLSTAFASETLAGLGEIISEENSTTKGVDFTILETAHAKGTNKSYVAEIPKSVRTSTLKPYVYYGSSLTAKTTMPNAIADLEKQGKRVICGTNADVYYVAASDYTSANELLNYPYGFMANEGRLVISSDYSSPNETMSLAFKSNGDVIYGSGNQYQTYVKYNNSDLKVLVNRVRYAGDTNLHMYTTDYGTKTASIHAGIEVILDVEDGDLPFKTDGKITATVKESKTLGANKYGNTTPITDSTIVLSANTNGTAASYKYLVSLKVGDKIEITTGGTNDTWKDIETGVGIFQMLVNNGVEEPHVTSNKETHPRTGMGIKSDGTMVLFVNEGFHSGGVRYGLTWREMVDYMKTELDCVSIFNFDGGGSCSFAMYDEELGKAKMINTSSDGNPRANTNFLFFVEDIPSYNVTTNITGKGQILGNSSVFENVESVYTLKPNDDYEVRSFKVNGQEVELINNKYTLTATSDVVIDVVFASLTSCFVTVDSNTENGTLSVDIDEANRGDNVIVTITPDEGYKLKTLKINGVEKSVTGNTYTITYITEDCHITAEFEQNKAKDPEKLSGGCNNFSSAQSITIAIALLLSTACVLLIARKRKKNN